MGIPAKNIKLIFNGKDCQLNFICNFKLTFSTLPLSGDGGQFFSCGVLHQAWLCSFCGGRIQRLKIKQLFMVIKTNSNCFYQVLKNPLDGGAGGKRVKTEDDDGGVEPLLFVPQARDDDITLFKESL